jgi:haloacetate dehalogenase
MNAPAVRHHTARVNGSKVHYAEAGGGPPVFKDVRDLPEARMAGRGEVWLRFLFWTWCYNPEPFTPEELAVCVRAYSQPGALRGAFSDYRAGEEDVAQDETDKDVLIECPTLVL